MAELSRQAGLYLRRQRHAIRPSATQSITSPSKIPKVVEQERKQRLLKAGISAKDMSMFEGLQEGDNSTPKVSDTISEATRMTAEIKNGAEVLIDAALAAVHDVSKDDTVEASEYKRFKANHPSKSNKRKHGCNDDESTDWDGTQEEESKRKKLNIAGVPAAIQRSPQPTSSLSTTVLEGQKALTEKKKYVLQDIGCNCEVLEAPLLPFLRRPLNIFRRFSPKTAIPHTESQNIEAAVAANPIYETQAQPLDGQDTTDTPRYSENNSTDSINIDSVENLEVENDASPASNLDDGDAVVTERPRTTKKSANRRLKRVAGVYGKGPKNFSKDLLSTLETRLFRDKLLFSSGYRPLTPREQDFINSGADFEALEAFLGQGHGHEISAKRLLNYKVSSYRP